MAATVVGGCTTLAFALLGGWLCDRVGRRSVMLVPRLGAALLTYPAFMFMIEQKTPAALFAVALLLSALTAMSGAASLVAIRNCCRARARYRSVAGLRLRCHHLRRHHPAGGDLADRGDRQSGLAGLVRHHHQRHRGHCPWLMPEGRKPEAELISWPARAGSPEGRPAPPSRSAGFRIYP